MKKRNLLAAAGLSLVSLGLTAAPAGAASYANDDLLLAFYATGGKGSSTSLVVDIGPASTYRDASSELFLSSIQADLINAFGANWATRGDVLWGVFGSSYNATVGADGPWTLYAVRAQGTVGTQAKSYNLGSIATQDKPGTHIHDLGAAYKLTGTASGLTVGVNPAVSVQDSSADNDFAGYQTNGGGTSFGYFNSALGRFANGVAGSALDLFRMPTGASDQTGTYKGTFTIGTDGVVRYSLVANPDPTPTPTPAPTATPAPEPVGKTPAQIQKQIKKVKAQLKAAKKIDDPAKKKAKLKKLKKKLQKLKKQLSAA
jgi:hypothetical protein